MNGTWIFRKLSHIRRQEKQHCSTLEAVAPAILGCVSIVLLYTHLIEVLSRAVTPVFPLG